MAKYRVIVPVEHVSGHQWYLVDATSPAEAIKEYKRGWFEFEDECLEVTELGEPAESDVEEVEPEPPRFTLGDLE